MSSEEEFLKKLRAAFVTEAEEQVERISSGLSSLTDPDEQIKKQVVENTFREIHNLKGSARAVNLLNLEAVCQALEDIFAALKRGEKHPDAIFVDALHEVVDSISNFLTEYGTKAQAEDCDVALMQLLHKIEAINLRTTGSDSVEREASPGSNAATEKLSAATASDVAVPFSQPEKSQSARKYANPLLDDFVFPDKIDQTEKTAPTQTLASAADLHREVVRIPAGRLDELLMRAEDMLSLKIMSKQHNQDLHQVGFKFDNYNRDWTKIYHDVRAARQLIERDEASPELLVIESVLTGVLEFLEQQQQHLSALSSQLTSLKTASLNDYRVASSTVDTFLENTKKLLMMPAATMLEVMPKLVRDLGRELGKEVDLTISGSTIQLDKRILTQLKDPIIHLLRNSIDHGLEKPEVRVQAGKSARGTININISAQPGNMVEISISDDGAGINLDRVKEIALNDQLITAVQAAEMSDQEVVALIFQSSFSTSATISEISGRGLGLAIVKENIANLGGKLLVESEKGKGTKFKIILPMTIATFRGVLVKCGSETLIVPTSDLERVMKLKAEQLQNDAGVCKINFGEKQIPFVSLNSILDLPKDNKANQHIQAIVLKYAEDSYAFEVDEVLEEQEILVKKLSKPIVRVKNVAGVAILGTGKPAVILNVQDLIKSAKKADTSRSPQRRTGPAPIVQKRILVVDDTITARILMKNILESAGYLVKTAADGAEALKLLTRESFDMLVSDIEMPKMNGIELTSAVRGQHQNTTIPIILVTSMTDPAYREKGTEAGANAIFVKSSFDKNNLVDVIKRLL